MQKLGTSISSSGCERGPFLSRSARNEPLAILPGRGDAPITWSRRCSGPRTVAPARSQDQRQAALRRGRTSPQSLIRQAVVGIRLLLFGKWAEEPCAVRGSVEQGGIGRWKPDLSLIVPAYNEARSIGATLDDFQAYLDLAARSLRDYRQRRRRRRHPRMRARTGRPRSAFPGHGDRRAWRQGWIRQGVAVARGRLIGFVDADNKTPIEELDKILPVEQGYDLVIGSRGLAELHIENPQPLHRRLGLCAFGILIRTFLGLHHVRDTQCGFKFFLCRGRPRSVQSPGHPRLHVRRRDPAPGPAWRVSRQGSRGGAARRRRQSAPPHLREWRNLLDALSICFGRCRGPAVEAPFVRGRRKAG